MNLVEYKPAQLKDIIIQNKEPILEKINECIHNNHMNMLLYGVVPKNIIYLIINEYYMYTYNIIPKKSILEVDCFSDLNLSAANNDIIIFSKSQHSYKKFVIIYNLEHIAENIQVYFKNIMNANTFFIFCSDCKKKVYESILTRCVHIEFEPLDYMHSKHMLELLCNQENITIEDPDEIIVQTQSNIDYIINLLNYMKLLKKTNIEKGSVDKYIQLIKDKDLLHYFELIKQKKMKEAFQILFDYYDKGFSILDIYYFMYEYSKTKLENPFNYKIIELLCEYIHNIYEGYDHKICLALLTNDINIIYHNI